MDRLISTPRGNITIRAACEQDAQAFRELRLEALRNNPEAFSADYATNQAQPATYWVDRLRGLGSESMIFFATHEDRLVGMCGIFRGNSPKTQHSGTVWGVYVQPEWRGMKIADALIQACVDWARGQNISILKLQVVNTNTSAIRCYERCGFFAYGTEPQAVYFNGKMYDDLLMARVT